MYLLDLTNFKYVATIILYIALLDFFSPPDLNRQQNWFERGDIISNQPKFPSQFVSR